MTKYHQKNLRDLQLYKAKDRFRTMQSTSVEIPALKMNKKKFFVSASKNCNYCKVQKLPGKNIDQFNRKTIHQRSLYSSYAQRTSDPPTVLNKAYLALHVALP